MQRPEGRFCGSDYRLIRRCSYCQAEEVDVHGSMCWRCSLIARRKSLSKKPLHRRITLRGYVVLFGLAVMALFGLYFMAGWVR